MHREQRKKILKAITEEKQITYKGKTIKIIASFSTNFESKKSME
jgi:hypothetical protein